MRKYLVDEMLRKEREKQKLVASGKVRHGYIEYDGKKYEYSVGWNTLEVALGGKVVLHSHIRNATGKPMTQEEVEKTVIYLLEQTKEMVAKVTGEIL